MKHRKEAAEQIGQALQSGKLFVADQTGFRRFIYARCPNDGYDCPVYRQERSGQEFTRLVFRCSICGTEFDNPVESLFLR